MTNKNLDQSSLRKPLPLLCAPCIRWSANGPWAACQAGFEAVTKSNKTWNFSFHSYLLQGRWHKTRDNSTLSVWPCDVWSSTQPRFFSLWKRYAWVPVDGSNQDVAGTRERSREELIKAASLSPPPSCWLAMTQAQTDEYLIPSGVALDTTSANPKSSSSTIWNSMWKYLLTSGAHHIIFFFVKRRTRRGNVRGIRKCPICLLMPSAPISDFSKGDSSILETQCCLLTMML